MSEDVTLELDEDEFWRIYELLAMEDGGLVFNTMDDVNAFLLAHDLNIYHVWTVSVGHGGWGAFCAPGVHAGGFGFVITKAPHNDQNVVGTWWDPVKHKTHAEEEDNE